MFPRGANDLCLPLSTLVILGRLWEIFSIKSFEVKFTQYLDTLSASARAEFCWSLSALESASSVQDGTARLPRPGFAQRILEATSGRNLK